MENTSLVENGFFILHPDAATSKTLQKLVGNEQQSFRLNLLVTSTDIKGLENGKRWMLEEPVEVRVLGNALVSTRSGSYVTVLRVEHEPCQILKTLLQQKWGGMDDVYQVFYVVLRRETPETLLQLVPFLSEMRKMHATSQILRFDTLEYRRELVLIKH